MFTSDAVNMSPYNHPFCHMLLKIAMAAIGFSYQIVVYEVFATNHISMRIDILKLFLGYRGH